MRRIIYSVGRNDTGHAHVEEERLSDGSFVYNVLWYPSPSTPDLFIAAIDKQRAHKAADALWKVARIALGE